MHLNGAPMSYEQRRVPRFPFIAPAELMVESSNAPLGAPLAGRVKELSRYGCYLDSALQLPKGTPVRLKIVNERDAFEASAMVIYFRENLGMGLAFRHVNRECADILERWLEQTAQRPPER
ncbi:MAG: hypothetical protein NVS9B4_16270 [Candidatus Acidiferrum sp.]